MTVVKSERLLNGAAAMLASEVEEGGENGPSSSMDNNFNQVSMPQAEARAIINLADTHQLIAGEKWFLVEAKWWERFVKQCDASASVRSDSVGPIDNSAILVKDIDGSQTLKANMVEKLDYILVPSEAYFKLKRVFGIYRTEHEIERGIIESGLFKKQMKVEVYPLTLRVAVALRETDAKVIVLSRAQTLADLVERVREALNCEHDKFKLYIHHLGGSEDDMYEPIDVEQKGASSSLEDLLYPNQLIVLDELADDGTGQVPDSKINKMNSMRDSAVAIPLPPPPPPLMSSVGSSSSGSKGALFGGPSSTSSSTFAGSSSSYYMRDQNVATPGTYPRGQCGLQNLGNTCFMNSALQCLSNVVDLTQYFLSDRYEDDINEDNPLGMHGQLARAYGELNQQMWSGSHRSILPRKLKTIIGQFAPRFSGYQQQDSQELLAFLLDGLHEDLNKVKKKPYVEEKEADGRPDKEVALESWADYRKRNDSIIVDLFHGQLKSTLVCPKCAKVSIKFDPFCFLSLPLPQRDKEINVDVTFVPRDCNKKWTKYKVSVPKKGPINNVLTAFASLAGVDADNLILAEVDCIGRIIKFPRGGDIMYRSSMSNSDELFLYELEDVPKEDDPVVVVATHNFRVHLYPIERSDVAHCDQSDARLKMNGVISFNRADGDEHKRTFIGRPIIYRTKKEALTRDRVADVIWKRAQDVFVSDSNGSDEDADWWLKEEDGDEQDEDSGVEESDRQDDQMMDADDNGNADANASASQKQSSTEDDRARFVLSASNNRDGPWDNFPADPEPFEPKPLSFYSAIPSVDSPVVYVNVRWHPMAVKNLWCEDWRTNIEPDSSMRSVANPPPKRQVTIDDCFDLFTKEEQLGEDDSWYCPKCKDHRRATKKLDLWQLPEVLIVHLKRFQYSRWYRDKIETVVEFPVRGLDLRDKVLNEAHAADLYDLIAISHHMGGLGGGHYTATALNNGRWIDFNDSQTSYTDISDETLASREAYVLLYRRRNNKQVIVRGIEPNIEMECDEEEE